MGEIARDQGQMIEIAVYGGSCLMLASDLRASTRDVDAIFLGNADKVYAIADQVRAELQLPEGWINQGVKYFLRKTNPDPALSLFGEYPEEGPPGMRCFVPQPEYLLAMKLMTDRDEPAQIAQDTGDIVGLMRVTGLQSKEQLHHLFAQCFPAFNALANVRARVEARIDDAIDQFAKLTPRMAATWHARRSGQTLS
jgi:hypothetical protein